MKGFIRLAAAGALILSLSVSVYADKSAKTELPAETTDYYMTVDSGGSIRKQIQKVKNSTEQP